MRGDDQPDARRADPRPSAAGQGGFARAVLDPDAPIPEGLAQVAGMPPSRRFSVYRNNVVASLVEALGAAYPAVKRLVGEEFFTAMASVHVRAHPPESPLMIFYGARFPDWLKSFPPAAPLPYLADVARLERARREAYHAEDAEPLDAAGFAAAVAGVPAERQHLLRLTLHPSLRLVASPYPLVAIWEKTRRQDEGSARLSGAECALTLRPRDAVETRRVSAGVCAFLAALAEGATLGAAATRAAETEPGFDLAAALSGALATGAIIQAHAQEEETCDV